jgi:hypothetical protein
MVILSIQSWPGESGQGHFMERVLRAYSEETVSTIDHLGGFREPHRLRILQGFKASNAWSRGILVWFALRSHTTRKPPRKPMRKPNFQGCPHIYPKLDVAAQGIAQTNGKR